jgi:predicted secreted protein
MKRSKKMIVVCHCHLNQNARAAGIEKYPAFNPKLLTLIRKEKAGVLQLPCPETNFVGVEHAPKDQEFFDTPKYNSYVKQIAKDTVRLMKRYIAKGYKFTRFIALKSSPSCGIMFVHCKGRKIRGQGLMIEAFRRELEDAKIKLPISYL